MCIPASNALALAHYIRKFGWEFDKLRLVQESRGPHVGTLEQRVSSSSVAGCTAATWCDLVGRVCARFHVCRRGDQTLFRHDVAFELIQLLQFGLTPAQPMYISIAMCATL
jgi:hypothetical protein